MTNETTESRFSAIVKIIPITFLISVLAHLSMMFYYSKFQFTSFAYLESYEILIGSMKDFILTTIMIIFIFQVSVLQAGVVSPYLFHKLLLWRRSRAYSMQVNNLPVYLPFKWYQSYGFLLFLYWLIFLLLVIILPKAGYQLKTGIIIFLGGIGIIFYLFWSHFTAREWASQKKRLWKTLKNYFPGIDPLAALALFGIIAFLHMIAVSKAEYILKKNPYKGSFIVLESKEKIKVTSKVILIGKSRQYYFLYNLPDSSVRVINREQIEKESVHIKGNTLNFFNF